MRTLRRPMFKIGGSAGDGITSGLAPRQGYSHEPGHVVQDDWRKRPVSDVYSGKMTIGELQDLTKAMEYKPRGTNVYDFLTEFGLNIASATPQGNIISTAAAAAKEPYSKFLTRKGEAEAAKYVSGSDMFKTLIKAGATAQGEAGGGKGWLKQWEFEQIPLLHDKIASLAKEIESGALAGEELAQAKRDLISSEDQLNEIVELDEMTKAWLKGDEGLRFMHGIREDLWREDQKRDKPIYKNDEDPQLGLDTLTESIRRLKKRRRTGATGGRVGYQGGGAEGVVSTGGYDTTGRPAYDMEGGFQPSNIPGMPEELSDISYEELRARLPQEVSNEVVRLLANSAEALEDFATIQTEQDISNFNKKYGVNLVLPAEG